MTREEALALVQKLVKTKNLVKHMLAVEAGMRALAAHLGEERSVGPSPASFTTSITRKRRIGRISTATAR